MTVSESLIKSILSDKTITEYWITYYCNPQNQARELLYKAALNNALRLTDMMKRAMKRDDPFWRTLRNKLYTVVHEYCEKMKLFIQEHNGRNVTIWSLYMSQMNEVLQRTLEIKERETDLETLKCELDVFQYTIIHNYIGLTPKQVQSFEHKLGIEHLGF